MFIESPCNSVILCSSVAIAGVGVLRGIQPPGHIPVVNLVYDILKLLLITYYAYLLSFGLLQFFHSLRAHELYSYGGFVGRCAWATPTIPFYAN